MATAPEKRLAMIRTLATAAGSTGMTGGQAMDLDAVGQTLSREQLEDMHRRKTGALILASVQLGALSGNASEGQQLALQRYGQSLGVAFQIVDDVLDVTSDTQTLGKASGADRARDKPTYPSVMGLPGSRALAEDLYRRALHALDTIGENAYTLRDLAKMMVHRHF